MDDLGEERNLALFKWRERRRMAIVHVICLVVYYYMIRICSQSRIVDHMLILEKERAREKIMKRIASSEGRKIIRMGPRAFLDLCAMLEQDGGLQSTQRVSIEEQVAKTLYILTHNVRNREVQFWFRRSGETTSRHFHRVLGSIVELEDKYLKQPDGSHIPIEILGSNRFNPFFKDCVGAIDCTHVRVKVPLNEASKYRGRKDFPTQNVLVACSFDLRFTYVLPGWEGTASDSRILKDAFHRTDYLRIPRGIMSESETKRETWTQEMDDVLVDAFLYQQNDGKKVGGSFTSQAYEAIIKELQQKFGRPFEKEKVKSCWKLIKRRFSKCFDLFKNGLSGFAWNPITKQWCAEPEVWQKLIEAKPKAKEWMGKPIHNYDKLMIVCGGDRATGQHSETAKDIRNKRSLTGESESTETIKVTFESAQEVGNENEVTSPEVQEIRSQEVKSKKARRSKDEEVEGIKLALHDIAGALREGNAALREGNAVYEKVKQKLPIPENEIWKLLEDLKIERQVFTRAYLYLLDNPERIRAVIGCPLDKRKELLLEMVLGPVGPSR